MSGRMKLGALKRKVNDVQKRTVEIREEKKKKKASRGKFKLEPVKKVAKEKKVNSTNVHEWFSAELKKMFGDGFVVSRWTVPQKKLAKELLGIYGDELTEKAVVYFCADWGNIVEGSRGSIAGAPNINLLWAMRERIFACVQNGEIAGKKHIAPKNTDEYTESDDPEVGW